ncbi:lachesin-like isoform X1 [Ceratina calcarata]|uniref:Lachesin-like isoform X1 n=1 Tax=Ceratina calcarata TaxID=156304 RepID=A0AAJ7J172_9HYME|nr:lachesin-like isoform X1 [Ceratina calcarata]XP_017881586.1 lachesin-like isoform X1 [Ceratina calcarata]XP_017881587.1 lachesin-like isoform X1 [Ceratina calcarata]XP_017881588.1 lachesin-like isoform X1 [Ceratina calcarata]XP_017881589.1 lachesin-like isoform X1 [Ceratina calcarata]XP_026670064.1 lachesin-like isoform X1 [Ceratina calcarata]XP_026670065.1 lachesin-like isoform X1 [Ceratina calcarata]XP_026670066.1 lachesin-like isoform X1 [Ceratina calcarata]XP_026670067.1 lachesin-lik
MADNYRRRRYLTITVLQIITIMCQALSDQPMFAEPIPNVTVPLGRDVNLPCVVENLGDYKVAWIHVGRQMLLTIHKHVVVKIPRFSVSHDNQKTWLLHINNVHEEDRGYYMCQLNTNPMMSQVGFLQVVVPPNILDSLSTESTIAVRENQNITLTCKADGYPTPKLMWKREDGQNISINRHDRVPLYDGEQLNLTRITRNEMGAYLCIATNGVPPTVSKRITVDVEFSPLIMVPNQLVGAPAGTNATIDCHTEAHPRAMSYWFLKDEMILSNEKYTTSIMENSYRTHMRLTIKNLQADDFGNYRCISKNSLGETEGSIRLYEIPKPSAAPKATEIKSSANKEGRPSTPSPAKRPTTVWPSSYNPYYTKRTERPPPPNEERVERPEQKLRGGQSTGSAYIIRWSAPQLMVVAVQYILTGPYMPPYVPQTAN